MIRITCALLALLWAPMVGAWCSLPPPPNSSASAPVQRAFDPLACMPTVAGIVGSGRGYLARDFPAVPGATSSGGSAWGWWCQMPDQTWRAQTVACLDRYCPSGAAKAVAAALAASQPLAALQAVLDGYAVRVTDWSETHDYNCLHSNMRAALQATKPAADAWIVDAATSADGTRPAYPFANGVRGSTSTARAIAGSACRPDVAQSPSGTAGKVYAAFGPAFSPALVALCRKP